MTLYHFGNCVALVYIPFHFVYKYSGLSEYGAFWKCVQAGFIYMVTQLLKMLLLATFFPMTETNIHGDYDYFGEWLKATVDLVDLGGIYMVLSKIPGKGHAKLLTAGIGWAGAEAILTRFISFGVGARGSEFHWKYIQEGLDSNISLFQHITSATLVWLWSRHDLSKSALPIVTAMLLLTTYKSLIIDLAFHKAMGPWTYIALKAGATLLLSIPTLRIYSGLAGTIGIY